MRSRIFVGLIAGTIGGFIGWLLQENLIHYSVVKDSITGAVRAVPLTSGDTRVLIYCVGGLIGMFLGGVDGVIESNTRKLARGMAIGALAGVILGFIGLGVGNWFYNIAGGVDSTELTPGIFSFARQVVARSLGWAFMGLGLGAGSAFPTFSWKRVRNGAIGGLIGGFIGGFIFDMLAHAANPVQGALGGSGAQEVGGPSRAVGFTAIGALTGLFIGIVDELFKEAWVKVLAGRNEGKDFILSKPINILGRDERCEVPLFGDIAVGVQHAAIRADGKRHVLIDAGTPGGTMVNGEPVEPGKDLLLRDGDMIQIGQHRILFRERATQSKLARQPVDQPKARPGASSVPMPSHLCPFCGAPKDAAGRCRCSVADGAPAGAGFAGGPPQAYPAPAPFPQYGAPDGFASAAPGMPAVGQLSGAEGPYAGQVFSLLGVNMMVGREAGCDIVLSADTTISRNHARLTNENGQFVVYDNGSSNGTFVNGQRTTAPVMLAPGDIVQFGASKFRFD